MERDLYQRLLAWKESERRKPLILNGARQVGKTYALQQFGKRHYDEVVYLNFEREEELGQYFEGNLDPKRILEHLSLHTGQKIKPGTTLLIFDEIQECPRAMSSLKYFCEEAPEYHLASAGSLLGVKTAYGLGFPVGKVNFLHLCPFSFFEFLSATGHANLRSHLEQLNSFEPLPSPLHTKLLDLLKEYLYVGGMPEAVKEFAKSRAYDTVREIQNEILATYERDFAKHAPKNQLMKILTVWEQIPQQLAKENKKFIFAAIKKSARGREYEEAIGWLIDAGLVLKSCQLKAPKTLGSGYKLFLLDTGLLGAQVNISAEALTENYVAQSLTPPLHYWTSPGTAEVDFILEQEGEIYPLEVKSGTSTKKKSLLVYDQKFSPKSLLRTSLLNLKQDGKIINFPLYLANQLPL